MLVEIKISVNSDKKLHEKDTKSIDIFEHSQSLRKWRPLYLLYTKLSIYVPI